VGAGRLGSSGAVDVGEDTRTTPSIPEAEARGVGRAEPPDSGGVGAERPRCGVSRHVIAPEAATH